MADLAAAGKALLEQFAAKLPEALRPTALELANNAEAVEALKVVGDSALMRADYSRQTQELQQEKARTESWRGDLTKWQTDHVELLKLGEAAKSRGWSPDAPDPTTAIQTPKAPDLPADVIRAGDLESREQQVVRYVSAAVRLAGKHQQALGEVLDIDELINDPRVKTLGIQGVYDAKYADRYAEKAKLSTDAERAKFEADIRADERKRLANRPLTPVGQDTSPLDALTTPTDKRPGSVSAEDLATEYEMLVAANTR